MKKQIRQVTGTQIGVTFTKEEQRIHNLEVGKIVDLTDMIVEGKVYLDIETLKGMTVGEIKKLTKEFK